MDMLMTFHCLVYTVVSLRINIMRSHYTFKNAYDRGSIFLHSVITRLSLNDQYHPTVILFNDIGEYITN